MSQSKYCLRWDSHKNNLSNGFSQLQQMQEFVDVTLAAGGHLVQAHQNILALGSPYIKEMLKSAPCQHPVIFLGPISPKVLALVLEYIYTGEVEVPTFELPSFIDAARMLHITGLKDMLVPERSIGLDTKIASEYENQQAKNERPTNIAAHLTIGDTNQVNAQSLAMEEMQSEDTIDTNHPSILKNLITIIPSKISNQKIDDVGNSSYAACININKDSHDLSVKVKPSDNYNILYTAEISGKKFSNENDNMLIEPEIYYNNNNDDIAAENIDNSSTGNLQVYDEADSLVTNFDPQALNNENNYISTCTSVLQDDRIVNCNKDDMVSDFEKMIDNQIVDNDKKVINNPSQENTEIEANISSESGLITISRITNTNDSNNGVKKPMHNDVLGNITTAIYTKTCRGSIRMILNRYIYNLHHTSARGRKHRWRCIEYRRNRCLAFIDTINEDISNRNELHNHSVHDSKIIKLARKQEIFTSLRRATKKD